MLDTQLCATLFVALTGISVAAVGLISLRMKNDTKNDAPNPSVTSSKLSELKLPAYRSVGYVYLAFACSVAGLVVTLVFSVAAGMTRNMSGFNALWYKVIVGLEWIVVPALMFLVLAFLYVGVGHLFNMTLMSDAPRGTLLGPIPGIRYPRWLVVSVGDLMSRGLFARKVEDEVRRQQKSEAPRG